ncbi:MAG: hypothetical protein M3294_00615, partial [Pseudomonadota bacterium]|nr:hypothetical protein [Pseudomonadota bacterium]
MGHQAVLGQLAEKAA